MIDSCMSHLANEACRKPTTKLRQARKAKTLPPRDKVKPDDTWDLASLFTNDDEWEDAFEKWEKQIPKYAKFRGTLGDGAEAARRVPEVRRGVRPRSASGSAPTPS